MWGRVSLVASIGLGCSGVAIEERSHVELQCSGTLPDTAVLYRYEATLSASEVSGASILVRDGAREARAAEAGDSVIVALDFLGSDNGGAFTFFPLGRFLAVEYIDPDESRYWSLLGCFD